LHNERKKGHAPNNYSKQRTLLRSAQTLKTSRNAFSQVSPRGWQSIRRRAAATVRDRAAAPSGEPSMKGSKKLTIPTFVSTEHATEWASRLNEEQHEVLLNAQRALSKRAADEPDLQLKIKLATQSQLMREAGEAHSH
jgi:hypothetical protein